jgi:hypothetical protein
MSQFQSKKRHQVCESKVAVPKTEVLEQPHVSLKAYPGYRRRPAHPL